MKSRHIIITVVLAAILLLAMLPVIIGNDITSETAEDTLSALPDIIRPASGGEMVLVRGGSFTMGDEQGRPDERPRTVTVSPFYIDRYPVVQSDFERLMSHNPSNRKAPDHPVEQLRWREAIEYCNRSSELEGLTPVYCLETETADFKANGYRLPTEAEWEYAARAGTTSRFFFGADERRLGEYAWFLRNSGGRTHPVGEKLPNPWGLYDILGNVWEWCHDWYAEYEGDEVVDPLGPQTGEQRVMRGGAYDSSEQRLRLSFRYRDFPDYGDVCEGYESYGFRRVRRICESISQRP